MTPKLKTIWRRHPAMWVGAGVLLVAGGGWGAVRLARQAQPKVPTAEVVRGELVEMVSVRGEIKALRSALVVAPSNAGDIQIVTLLKTGTLVKKGDVVAVLDTVTQQTTLEQAPLRLKTSRGANRKLPRAGPPPPGARSDRAAEGPVRCGARAPGGQQAGDPLQN